MLSSKYKYKPQIGKYKLYAKIDSSLESLLVLWATEMVCGMVNYV